MFKSILKVLKSVREFKIFAIITPLFMIGEAAMECAMPFIMGIFVDEIKLLTTPDSFFQVDEGIPVFYIALILIGMAIIS